MAPPPDEDFAWLDGERLVRFGAGAVAEAPALLERRGFEGYALLSTARGREAAPALARGAAASLDVPPGPVPEAAAAVRAGAGDRPLVALGGGRVIDAAKAIAGADGLRCAAVPTTLSGAEMTRIHRMPAGVEQLSLVRPELVVADPALMASQPMPGLAASAMNALGHAAEALYVPGANPVASLASLRAAELIAGALSAREPDRPALALGALLAAYALGSTGLAIHHVVCQTVVRVAGTPHAQTNAVLLPHALAFVEPRAPQALGRLAAALGPAGGAASAGARAARLAARAGPTRLRDLGVSEAALDDIAGAAARRPQLAATPGGATRDDVKRLLGRAF